MPIEIEQIPCNFVGDFKVGDNLRYNTDILCGLVDSNRHSLFNKPIVLQVGSILEAALSEIIYRAQNHTIEGVPNIAEKHRRAIKGKKIDIFSKVIDVMQKYEILDGLGDDIYTELHKLRCYRNKIHIQGYFKGASWQDEPCIFSNDVCAWALKLNQRVLKNLSEDRPRAREDLRSAGGSLRVPRCVSSVDMCVPR